MLPISLQYSLFILILLLSLSFLETSINSPAPIIVITTFSLSFLGVYLGKKFGDYFEKNGVLGGIILIVIGLRIVFEHQGTIG